MKKILAIALVLVVALTVLVSCGGSAGIVGEYKLKSMMGMDIAALAEAFGSDASEIENSFSLVINADGTGTMKSEEGGGDITWKLDGDQLSMTAEGETITGTFDGTDITLTESGVSMVFTKK